LLKTHATILGHRPARFEADEKEDFVDQLEKISTELKRAPNKNEDSNILGQT
jgi:hypothetical protein